jgi:hypothetical protein
VGALTHFLFLALYLLIWNVDIVQVRWPDIFALLSRALPARQVIPARMGVCIEGCVWAQKWLEY